MMECRGIVQVAQQNSESIQGTVWKVSYSVPVYFSKMAHSYFIKAANTSCVVSLKAVYDAIVLCDDCYRSLKMGPKHVDRLDFSDHHLFQTKDFDRAPEVLKDLDPYQLLVLCSRWHILPYKGHTEDSFKKFPRRCFEILSDSDIT